VAGGVREGGNVAASDHATFKLDRDDVPLSLSLSLCRKKREKFGIDTGCREGEAGSPRAGEQTRKRRNGETSAGAGMESD